MNSTTSTTSTSNTSNTSNTSSDVTTDAPATDGATTAVPTPGSRTAAAAAAPSRRTSVRQALPSKDVVTRAFGTVRGQIGSLLALICLVAAIALALGAALVVLKANADNALVKFVMSAADLADLEVFSKDDGIKQFTGDGAEVKNVLVNWGLGAIAWIVLGRIIRRLFKA